MNMCKQCHRAHVAHNWYLNGRETIVKAQNCHVHPTLDNWRVARCMMTILSFGLEGDGHTVAVGAPGSAIVKVKINCGDGWVHFRNLKLKLFDYEQPFLDLLLSKRMLEKRDCVRRLDGVEPVAVRVTTSGQDYIREFQLRQEAERQVDAKLAMERV